MFINVGLVAAIVTQINILKKAEINYQMNQFKASGEAIKIDFNGCAANRIRFAENNVPYSVCKLSDTAGIKVVWSLARVKPSKPLPNLPEPWLMKLESSVKINIMTIAAFDFDGTLTTKDTLMVFLKFVFKKSELARGLLVLAPTLIAFKLKLMSNDKAKEKLFAYFLKEWIWMPLTIMASVLLLKLIPY